MSDQNFYRLTALDRTYDVRRVYLNIETHFTEAIRRPLESSASAKQSDKYRHPRLLPTSPLEVEALSLQAEFHEAGLVTDTQLFVVDELPVSGTETVKDLRAKALKQFEGHKGSINRKYDDYTRERFGKSHSALVGELREQVIERFKAAFKDILYVPEMESWRLPGVREFVMGYELAADCKVINELIELAGCGHVHSQYLAALLLCFTQQGLTQQSVELLLQAHENRHPQALDALGRFLLTQCDYVGAVQAALISMQGQYPEAKDTVRLVQRTLTMTMLPTPRGIVPAFAAVLDILDNKYLVLARKHFPAWFRTEEERAQAFFRRVAGGASHV